MVNRYKKMIGYGCFVVSVFLLSIPLAQLTVDKAKSENTERAVVYPHFASLRFEKVNLRAGPGLDHIVLQTYHKKGLPIEVLALSTGWLKVRDFQGQMGWMRSNQTRSSRFVIIRPWDKGTSLALRDEPRSDAKVRAWLVSPSLASVSVCDGAWCKVAIEDVSGWLEQKDLWGVYSDERVNG